MCVKYPSHLVFNQNHRISFSYTTHFVFAIIRGTKKDFIDYYYLLKTYSLKELLDLYVRKFSDAQLFTAIKSLTYFQDAEADPMPRMTENLDWENVKKSIVDTVNAYI